MPWTGGPKGQAKIKMSKEALRETRERAEVSAWLKEALARGYAWEARHRKRRRR